MSFHHLRYHFVWATKGREPLIEPRYEAELYELMRTKTVGLGGVVYALNGTPDHVHLVASVPPRISLAKFVKGVKATSSHKFNAAHGDELTFHWQPGYGVFSLGDGDVKKCIAYVEAQKRHHAERSTIAVLERMD